MIDLAWALPGRLVFAGYARHCVQVTVSTLADILAHILTSETISLIPHAHSAVCTHGD